MGCSCSLVSYSHFSTGRAQYQGKSAMFSICACKRTTLNEAINYVQKGCTMQLWQQQQQQQCFIYPKYLNTFSNVSEALEPRLQDWFIAAGAYPGFCSMKRLEVFLLPLDGMLVHRRSLPLNLLGFPQQLAGTHLYTWVERETVRVKCLAQEHNSMSPAKGRTQTTRSRIEHTNHEATAPPANFFVI